MAKQRLMIAGATALAIMLTGCASAAPDAGSADEAATLRLAFWDEAQKPAMQALADEYMEDHENITVELEVTPFDQYWTKLETSATGRSAPDVFWMSMGEYRRFANAEVIADLQPLVERDNFSMDGIYPELQTAYAWEDSLWAMPKDLDNLGLWYNKALFDAAGLEYPDGTWGWDDVTDAAKALTDPAAGVWGIAAEGGNGNDRPVMSTVFQNGGTFINPDGSSGFESPETIEAFQWWVDMILVDQVSPTVEQMASTSALDLFKTGKVAMLYDGSWRASVFGADPAAADFDVAPLPVGDIAASAAHGIGYAMYADSKYPEQTWEFVKFLGSERASEIQAEFGAVIPAHEASGQVWVDAVPQFNLQAFIDQAADAAVFIPSDVNTGVVRAEAKKIFQKAFTGEISVEEAAAEATAYLESLRN